MNDDFLYRLRETPPRNFALELKARLDRRSIRRFTVRSRYLHGFGIALLVGGAAYAITTATLRGWRSADVEPRAVSTAAPEAPSPAAATGARGSPESRPPRAVMPAAADLASSAGDALAPAARVPAGAGHEQAGGGARDPVPTLGVEQRPTAVARGGVLRDRVGIVGTPATLPYSESALRFFERYDFAKPTIEIHPEREAVALFCNITHSPRSDVLVTFTRMGSDASGFCVSDRPRMIPGLRAEIVELEIGYEAAVVARSVLYGSVALPARALFLALAREVPDPRVVPNPRLVPELVANPYRAWYEIDPLLPYDRIELIGPSPDSAAARSSLGIIMELGCAAMPSMVLRDRNPSRYAEICRTVRSDGVYRQISGANDLIARLETYPTVFGVLSYDTFARNRAKLAAAVIDGVAPTRETLADGQYPAARTLYVYVNEARARTAPGFRELVETYLRLPQIARVLVPLDETKRREMQTRAAELGGKK